MIEAEYDFFQEASIEKLAPLLSKRAYTCLVNEDIRTIGQLKKKSDAELLRIPNFGKKSLQEIKEALAWWDKQPREIPVPVALPHPYEAAVLELLKSINQHLAIIEVYFARSRSDEYLVGISAMLQYLFEQNTGLNVANFIEGAMTRERGARQR